MEGMREDVLRVLTSATALLGAPFPDADGLELGDEHETVAVQYGGHIALLRHDDGTVHPIRLGGHSD